MAHKKKTLTKRYTKIILYFLGISIGISMALSFLLGGFRFSLIKVSDLFFITGAIIAILGGIVLMGTWMHIKKVLRETPKDQEVDAQSLAPKKFAYACLMVGAVHMLLSIIIAFMPLVLT